MRETVPGIVEPSQGLEPAPMPQYIPAPLSTAPCEDLNPDCDAADPNGDPDGDGLPNQEEPDNDNDGIPDEMDLDCLMAGACDNPGSPEYEACHDDPDDPDDDDDGIPDEFDPDSIDSDADGIVDICEDYCDPEDKAAGYWDLLHECLGSWEGQDEWTNDEDCDGVPDPYEDWWDNRDTDGDDIPDVSDPDDDNDGRPDDDDDDDDGDGILDVADPDGDCDNDGIPNLYDCESLCYTGPTCCCRAEGVLQPKIWWPGEFKEMSEFDYLEVIFINFGVIDHCPPCYELGPFPPPRYRVFLFLNDVLEAVFSTDETETRVLPVAVYRRDAARNVLGKFVDGQNDLKLIIEDQCCKRVLGIQKDFTVNATVSYRVKPYRMTYIDRAEFPAGYVNNPLYNMQGFAGQGQIHQTDRYQHVSFSLQDELPHYSVYLSPEWYEGCAPKDTFAAYRMGSQVGVKVDFYSPGTYAASDHLFLLPYQVAGLGPLQLYAEAHMVVVNRQNPGVVKQGTMKPDSSYGYDVGRQLRLIRWDDDDRVNADDILSARWILPSPTFDGVNAWYDFQNGQIIGNKVEFTYYAGGVSWGPPANGGIIEEFRFFTSYAQNWTSRSHLWPTDFALEMVGRYASGLTNPQQIMTAVTARMRGPNNVWTSEVNDLSNVTLDYDTTQPGSYDPYRAFDELHGPPVDYIIYHLECDDYANILTRFMRDQGIDAESWYVSAGHDCNQHPGGLTKKERVRMWMYAPGDPGDPNPPASPPPLYRHPPWQAGYLPRNEHWPIVYNDLQCLDGATDTWGFRFHQVCEYDDDIYDPVLYDVQKGIVPWDQYKQDYLSIWDRTWDIPPPPFPPVPGDPWVDCLMFKLPYPCAYGVADEEHEGLKSVLQVGVEDRDYVYRIKHSGYRYPDPNPESNHQYVVPHFYIWNWEHPMDGWQQRLDP